MTVETPGSQSALREANQRRVIHAVRSAGALTQAEIARTTGLSTATVSNIVRELRDVGTVLVTPTYSGGRRAQSVSLARATGLLLGVEIGVHRLRVVLADHDHRVLADESIAYDAAQSADRGIRRTEWLATTLLRQARVDRTSIRGVGVCLPGPVDPVSGALGAPDLLPAWQGTDVTAELSERLDLPVFVDSHVNAAAMGEQVWGAGRESLDMIYVDLSTYVSAALVLRGELYDGASGLAGQLGHITVDEHGRICRCGNRGCLETLVGGASLLALLPPGWSGHGPDLRSLVEAARAGDLGCRRIIADAGRAVGAATAMLCNVLNPSRVVIGGELAESDELLLKPVRETLARQTVPRSAAAVEVIPAELGDGAAALGTIVLLERRLGIHPTD